MAKLQQDKTNMHSHTTLHQSGHGSKVFNLLKFDHIHKIKENVSCYTGRLWYRRWDYDVIMCNHVKNLTMCDKNIPICLTIGAVARLRLLSNSTISTADEKLKVQNTNKRCILQITKSRPKTGNQTPYRVVRCKYSTAR